MIGRGKGWGAASALRQFAGLLGLAWMLGTGPGIAALPSATHAGDLARVEDYLNRLTTLKADFVQINPDGGTVTGELYYQRPDKMRLDYDPPSDILIISDGWHITYYDRRLEQVSHVFPSSTPLGFLLDDEIRLSGDVTVTEVQRSAGELHITLVQTDEPNEGSIRLSFGEEPLELRRWTLVDAQGLATHVMLERPQTGLSLDRELFRFRNPQFYPDARN
ncbi:MAG TPA: outer membrane lipoprotein carrier protein LolA [Geminicoccaceae bacterium]